MPLQDEIDKLSEKHNNGPYRKGVIRKNQVESDVIEKVEKMKDSHLVVAILIATVTFTAAFTVPGGYKEEESKDPGSPILSKNSAFQVFVITNATAMTLSVLAVYINFFLSLPPLRGRFFQLHGRATYLTMLSMGAMVSAFVMGSFAVLSSSLWLTVVIFFYWSKLCHRCVLR